tara:strand:+ start:216 stop:665 length:450 start_codon:yes stop_codon:yes gene_type:complete
MALKSDRYELQTDISFFYNDGTATRGCAVVHDSTAGSGAAMDQGVNLVKKATSGNPVGILLNDVVNKDLTRTHLNQHKDEVQKGGKVTVLRKGYVVTNAIDGSPVAGSGAYISGSVAGNISMVESGTKIGAFLSSKDEDGYCKVEVNLP